MDETNINEEYVDEFVYMTIHQLVKRNCRKALELVNHNDVIGFPQSSRDVIPNTRVGLTLAFITIVSPIQTRSNLFKRNSGRSNPGFRKSQY